MHIRKAAPDDAGVISDLLLLAMEEIVSAFIGEKSNKKARLFLKSLISKKANQYSYENCWVAENADGPIAAAIVYEGARLKELRDPVIREIKKRFNNDFFYEDETQAGEFYIDSIGVNPTQQGKGVGSNMLRFLIGEYVEKRKQTLGLLVDENNPNAKRLYLQLGFVPVGRKTLAGKKMEHLQRSPAMLS
ncbi:GNAT family N-acetyltransferase [Parapedobacter lycopersici]|uniref:GNAT family N-acetyltransferase n=1 Tax=Parapedobacter lycopersici TaxID=1864939 RepID=UPI00214D492E|nr:GNAT family N-acetyltransferase [Parapedobacter lycopersici]